jgi:hypothetical protein
MLQQHRPILRDALAITLRNDRPNNMPHLEGLILKIVDNLDQESRNH